MPTNHVPLADRRSACTRPRAHIIYLWWLNKPLTQLQFGINYIYAKLFRLLHWKKLQVIIEKAKINVVLKMEKEGRESVMKEAFVCLKVFLICASGVGLLTIYKRNYTFAIVAMFHYAPV